MVSNVSVSIEKMGIMIVQLHRVAVRIQENNP